MKFSKYCLFKRCILFIMLLGHSSTSCSHNDEMIQVTASTLPVDAGIVEGTGTYPVGSVVTFSAIEKEGFIFKHWENANERNKPISYNQFEYKFKVHENSELVAVFDQNISEVYVSPEEALDALLVPDYDSAKPENELLLKTRYIGDEFVTEGVSLEKSGVINDNGNITMVINTLELEDKGLYREITGGGPHIWLQKIPGAPRPKPWVEEDMYLRLNAEASVPHVYLQDPLGNTSNGNFTSNQAPVTQLSFGVMIRDIKNNVLYTFIVPMYESRGMYKERANAHDTFHGFASSPIASSSIYITKAPLSESLQSKPFNDKKYFEIHLTRENLENVIRDSPYNLSSDLTQYELRSVGILFELPNYVKNGHNVSMVKISNFKVSFDRIVEIY